jgi:hypothetical protein
VIGPDGGPARKGSPEMSKYLILIYDEEAAWMNASEDVANELMAKHNAFGEKNGEAVLGGNALQSVSTATTLRPDGSGGLTVTDGPFLETKEALGGYYLVEAADLDEAIEMARQVPLAGASGGLEVRPIMVFS